MACPCLGRRLRHYRTKHHLTQQALAHAVGCTRVAITQFEAGTTTPSLAVLVRLKTAVHAPSLDALVLPCPCQEPEAQP